MIASWTDASASYGDEQLGWNNKPVDAVTGWSDHGARWMATEMGRWMTPDPPVKGPSGRFLLSPWTAHPYQYVRQNPLAFWDPDGRLEAPAVSNVVGAGPGATATILVELGVSVALGIGAAKLIQPSRPSLQHLRENHYWRRVRDGTAGRPKEVMGPGRLRPPRIAPDQEPTSTLAPEQLPTAEIQGPPEPSTTADQPTAGSGVVNIDTGTAVALSSENPGRLAVESRLAGRKLVMTATAFSEFTQGNLRAAGRNERQRAAKLLERITVVPDAPSDRAAALQTTGSVGANDKIIFGTGDTLGVPTATSDRKFLRGSKAQGVEFEAIDHDPVPFTGQ